LYSNLFAFVSTKSWSTSIFPIQRGVFQGDTLSPLIFLLCFNPIVMLAKKLKGEGFSLYLPIPDSEDLPPIGSHFYVEWKEVNSSCRSPWVYLCTAVEYHSDGTTTIQYLNENDGATERVDLHSVLWSLAQKNSKRYLPLGSTLKKRARVKAFQKKFIHGKQHKVKAFVDDLSLIHSSPSVHQEELQIIDSHCQDLDLKIRPDKCVSLAFSGTSMMKFTCPLSSGPTAPIQTKPAKILGQMIGKDATTTRSAASTKLKSRFLTALSNI